MNGTTLSTLLSSMVTPIESLNRDGLYSYKIEYTSEIFSLLLNFQKSNEDFFYISLYNNDTALMSVEHFGTEYAIYNASTKDLDFFKSILPKDHSITSHI